MSLGIFSLYTGLESHFGLDVIRLNTGILTTSIGMVALDGSPITVGWFQESRRRGLPHPAPDTYALTVVPENARTVEHRIRLTQAAPYAEITLVEDDSDDYLEGLESFPTILDRRTFDSTSADPLIRALVVGAKVLNTTQDESMIQTAHQTSLAELRKYGQDLYAQISPYFQINDPLLDRFANL